LNNMRRKRAKQRSFVLFEDVSACGSGTTHFLEVYCPHLLWNMEYFFIFSSRWHL